MFSSPPADILSGLSLPPEWPIPHLIPSYSSDQTLSLTLASSPVADDVRCFINGGGGAAMSSMVGPRRVARPLGPFTGYAVILKNSEFLKPAQQLLEEFCCVVRGFGGGGGGGQECGDDFGGGVRGGGGGDAVVSGSGFGGEVELFQRKRAKLLCMQEEVCRRYKQCHLQMQMAVSSFESVPGLCSATPYTTSALKAVSKHFKNLKNTITFQLGLVSKILGEEPILSPSSGKGEPFTSPHPNYDKQKFGESSLRLLENSPPVWRPQRGLPERAVSILRTWLFEHFLHPYPTDTDKLMLATHTGLSRNQVSNWFINARVRLWKPMVEEIHMLETQGTNRMDLNSCNRKDFKFDRGGVGQNSGAHSLNAQSNQPAIYPSMNPVFAAESSQNGEQWHCEKRSRAEDWGTHTSMDGGLMNFASYPHTVDISTLGPVSLTLGLQHEVGQQHPQQLRHFGSHMFRDFGG